MATVMVTAPNADYTGTGPGGVKFVQGEATVDTSVPAQRAALAYFRDRGYGIAGDEPVQPETPEQPDSRDVTHEHAGARLRDAAVNPREVDYLVPTNAGDADPHGPLVVSPGPHASTPGPVHPGPVDVDDPRVQEARETSLASDVFVDGMDVPAATQRAAGSNAQNDSDRPVKSATKAEWVDWVAGLGVDRAEAESWTKSQLADYEPGGED
jgi:hypothetical protein